MKNLALPIFFMMAALVTSGVAADEKWNPSAPMPHDIVVGNPNASVTVVEYASLTCPHCGRFHHESMPSFKEKMLDTGKAKLIYRHLPLDQSALAGAIAATCAPENLRFEVVSALFEELPVWAPDITKMVPVLQSQFGEKIDPDKMLECAKNSAISTEIVKGMQIAIDNGVSSTPTFFINGEQFSGHIPADDFNLLVEKAK